jgi:hypothetical protein
MRKHPNSWFVICVDDRGDDLSLTVGKVYEALAIERLSPGYALIHVIDNEGEDYPYSADQFVEVKLLRAAQQAVLRAR